MLSQNFGVGIVLHFSYPYLKPILVYIVDSIQLKSGASPIRALFRVTHSFMLTHLRQAFQFILLELNPIVRSFCDA